MHRMLLVLLLLASTAFSYPLTFEGTSNVSQKTLKVACEFTKLDCTGIEPPAIMLINTEPVLAFYLRRTNILFLTETCGLETADETLCEALLVHEVVHYIHSQLGLYQDDMCANEAGAWRAYDLYVTARKRPDLTRPDWRTGYPKCQGE